MAATLKVAAAAAHVVRHLESARAACECASALAAGDFAASAEDAEGNPEAALLPLLVPDDVPHPEVYPYYPFCSCT